jgi:hypothetical protein
MMTVHRFHHGTTVMDGKHVVAVARPRGRGSNGCWMLTLRGASWLDPRARKPAVTGKTDPSILIVPHRTEADALMLRLAATGASGGLGGV